MLKLDTLYRTLNENAVNAITLSSKLVDHILREVCDKYELPEKLCRGDYQMLQLAVEAKQNSVTMAECSRKLSVNPSSATRRVRRLELDGLSQRTNDEHDDRCYLIQPTQKGYQFAEEVESRIADELTVVYQRLSKEKLSIVNEALTDFIASIKLSLDSIG